MDYEYLKELEGSLKEIIDSPEISDKKFYQALRDLIDLKLNVEEFNHKFDQIGDVMSLMARGEFNQRVDIPISRNLFAFIGTSINSVIDELDRNVTKISFMEPLLEAIPQPAIITDKDGIILFCNKSAYAFTNYPPKYLLKLKIHNLFEKKLKFGESDTEDFMERVNVSICLYNKIQLIETVLTIQKVINRNGTLDGYLYTFE